MRWVQNQAGSCRPWSRQGHLPRLISVSRRKQSGLAEGIAIIPIYPNAPNYVPKPARVCGVHASVPNRLTANHSSRNVRPKRVSGLEPISGKGFRTIWVESVKRTRERLSGSSTWFSSWPSLEGFAGRFVVVRTHILLGGLFRNALERAVARDLVCFGVTMRSGVGATQIGQRVFG